MPHLQITEVVLIHFNIINNNYHQDSRVLYTFVPGQLFYISPKNFVFLKTNSEVTDIEVWFTNQNSKSLET